MLLFTPLLISTSLAQQTETESARTTLPALEPESETANTPQQEKPRAASRFTPTEKIDAGDAVSFPVDI